jgi:hypothetical protein
MAHEMRIMDGSGDTKLICDTNKKVEVDVARDTFNRLTKKGYKAFKVAKKGEPGEAITEFDPGLEKIILAAPISGG